MIIKLDAGYSDFELSKMGRQALLNHCIHKKRKGNYMKMNLFFFQPRRVKANPSEAVVTDTACDISESSESLFTHAKPCS